MYEKLQFEGLDYGRGIQEKPPIEPLSVSSSQRVVYLQRGMEITVNNVLISSITKHMFCRKTADVRKIKLSNEK